MPYSDWLALIKEFFLKKTALNQTVFYGIEVKYFLPLTSLFLIDFHKNCHEFSTEKVLTTHKIFLC